MLARLCLYLMQPVGCGKENIGRNMAEKKKGKRVPGGRGPRLSGGSGSNSGGRLVSPRSAPRTAKRKSQAKPRKVRVKVEEPGRFRRFLRWLFSWRMLSRMFSIGLTLSVLLLIAMIYFAQNLPDISGLGAARKTPGIQVLSASGEVIGSYGQIYGDYLQFNELPKPLVDAVVATEDRRFFSHFGVDPLGIARAMVANLRAGRFVQGGSTVTQQLAKNVFLTPDRTLKRKLQEMLLAFWLEARFSKEEIMSIYLNRVYLGAGNYGVDAAARQYFGKSARDLTVAESAVIAGLLKAPSRYSPTSDPELARNRAHQVLLNMADAGMMSKEVAERALATLHYPDKLLDGKGERYFSDWIVDMLPDYLSNVQEDIIIRTTLEPSMQRYAEEAVAAQMTPEAMEKQKMSQVALLAMRPDGAVVAMIGGRDYAKSQFNRAVQAHRQPGSAFKMFIYLAAMEAGWTPDDMMEDKPTSIPVYRNVWRPKNYDGKYHGEMTLRQALTKSINTIAAQLIQQVGPQRVVLLAKRLGVRSDLVALPSLALGSSEVTLLELTTAYAHLASDGMGVRPYAITEIRSRKDDEAIYEYHPPFSYLVLQPDAVAMMNSMLMNVINNGTGRGAAIGRPAAGKTGTASDYKDAWFMGYTPDLVAGVWIGNDEATPMAKVTGGSIPARIWKGFMSKSLAQTAAHDLPTGYTVATPSEMPWEDSGDAAVGLGAASPRTINTTSPRRTTTEQSQKPRGNKDVDLGRSFWDKLFNENVEVEYDYPTRH